MELNVVTILILIDGFLQLISALKKYNTILVTILILIDGFLQSENPPVLVLESVVTILILIDGFLQFVFQQIKSGEKKCHNPYFNRWFSAIC